MEAIGVAADVGAVTQLQPSGNNGHESAQQDPVPTQVQRSYELVQERGSELSIVVAGLDGFRMVNEYLGPIEGDTTLAAFADCVGGRLETPMHLCGDQLIGLLPEVNAPEAVDLARALR